MKIYAIKNEYDNTEPISFLIYFEKTKTFYIEISDKANERQVPFAFLSSFKKSEMTLNPAKSLRWVKERIIPSDRQNISQILRDNGLKTYDEFELLRLGQGRCAQDDFCLIPITETELPYDIKERHKKHIDDIFPLAESKSFLVFFKDGRTKVCKLRDVEKNNPALENYLSQFPELIIDVKIQPGGYGIYWNDNMTIQAAELYQNGIDSPITKTDLVNLVSSRVVNSAETARLLNCTRQNVDYLVKKKQLTPVKETAKDKWFLKGDVLKRDWK